MAYRVKKIPGLSADAQEADPGGRGLPARLAPGRGGWSGRISGAGPVLSPVFPPPWKGRKALFSALLRKTEASSPPSRRTCPSAKYSSLCLGGDLGQAEIVLIYDRERFQTFWLRTDPADGLWTLQKDRLSADGAGAVLHAPGAVRAGGVPLGGLCGADADLGLWGAALTHRRYL